MEIDDKINEFSKLIEDKFKFLEDDYHFQRGILEKIDFQYVKDQKVRIVYYSGIICIVIEWYLIESNIGIGIIELNKGKIPEKYSYYDNKFFRAIGLSDLVEYKSKGTIKNPLPQAGGKLTTKQITKAWKEREQLINNEMENLLDKYSLFLKEYASEVLKGDLSMFPIIQKFSKDKISNDYY